MFHSFTEGVLNMIDKRIATKTVSREIALWNIILVMILLTGVFMHEP